MIEVAVSPVHLGDTDLNIYLTNSGPYECLSVIFVIRLSPGLMRLRGNERIGPLRLLPGETVCEKLRVRAERPGRYQLTSPNFSYRDHNGKAHREASFTAEIIVYPAPDPAPRPVHEPRISIELQTRELPLDEWTILHCRLSNVGVGDAEKLKLALSGQVAVYGRSQTFALDRLAPGAAANASFYVRAQEAGAQVPIYLDLTYGGPSGRRSEPTVATISVSSTTPVPKPPQSPGELIKVLYLAANPVDPANPGKRRLRVDDEFREIQRTLSEGRERDNIRLESRWAVQSRDITEAIFAVEPHFVHFAGHGDTKEGSIVVGDEDGFAHTIPVDGLVQAFRTVGRSVRCVIVNACSTERLAQSLAAVGLCVIGMRQPVGDQSAVRFSIGFYQAVAVGQSVETAFGSGVAQLMMTPLGDDARAPFLLCGGQQAR